MSTTRIATESDRDLVRSIATEAFATVRTVYRPYGSASQRQDENRGDETVVIASVANMDVGTVRLFVDDGVVHVIGLAVLPRFRHRGVARDLVDWSCEFASQQTCEIVRLDTIRETGNVVLFSKLGFRVVSEKLADWCFSDRFEKLHDVRMETRLT